MQCSPSQREPAPSWRQWAAQPIIGFGFSRDSAARKLALTALGEATRDFTAGGRTGRIVLEVREESRPVLTVFASIEALTKGAESEGPVAASDAAIFVPRGY